jgi:hypothetical protein
MPSLCSQCPFTGWPIIAQIAGKVSGWLLFGTLLATCNISLTHPPSVDWPCLPQFHCVVDDNFKTLSDLAWFATLWPTNSKLEPKSTVTEEYSNTSVPCCGLDAPWLLPNDDDDNDDNASAAALHNTTTNEADRAQVARIVAELTGSKC